MRNAILAAAGLTAGHFLYQWVTGRDDWGTAIERSFFQVFAVVSYELVFRRPL